MGVQTQTRFNTALNGAITDVQTTAVLDAAPAQTIGYGTIDRGGASEEDVYWGNLAGLQLTNMLRGLSKTALTNTEVAGNKKAHLDNAVFESTLLHYIVNNKADVDDNEAITGSWTFNTQLPTSTDTPGANAELTTKIYVDTQDNLKGNLSGGNTWAGTQIFADDAARSTTNAAPVTATAFSNKQYVDDQIAAQIDDAVDASAADTTPGSLDAKITFNTHLSRTIVNPAGDEDFRINTDAIQSTTGVANANQLIATDANGRLDSTFLNSSALTIPMVALEAVTAGNALALLPNEVEYFTQLTDANLALGDSNVRRRYAIRIVPTVTTSTLTTMLFRAAEAVNGATTLGDLNISIQTDNAGNPSGTVIPNGSANAITQATQRTWTNVQADRTATWAAAPTLTAGTVYWLVFAVSATDAVNFLNLSVNSNHDENYVIFTRLTFNLDAGTWGNSATNATPFFWFDSQPKLLGVGVVPTDTEWGARAWNFIGFARTTQAVNTSVDVYYDIAPNQTNLIQGRSYYLSGVAGAIAATTPGGTHFYTNNTEPAIFAYRIGRAIATTTLKIERGVKRIVINETGIAGTTVRQYVTWFRPEIITVSASEAVTNDSVISQGYVDANAGDIALNMAYNNAAAGGAGTATTSVTLATDSGANFSAAASSFTDIGFTYTYTQTAGTMYSMLKVEQ